MRVHARKHTRIQMRARERTQIQAHARAHADRMYVN